MSDGQEEHLARIKTKFVELVDSKYRAGAAEHGSDLLDMTMLKMIDSSIEEAVDLVTYLFSLREKFTGQSGSVEEE